MDNQNQYQAQQPMMSQGFLYEWLSETYSLSLLLILLVLLILATMAWSTAVQSAITQFVKMPTNQPMAYFVYAIVMTLILVFAYHFFKRVMLNDMSAMGLHKPMY